MEQRSNIGTAADIIKEINEIFSDPDRFAEWLDECREFEARGYISIETQRQNRALADVAYGD